MRIGHDDNYLSIELRQLDGACVSWLVEAGASFSGGEFRASHDHILASSSPEDIEQFDHFASSGASGYELTITEGGWLRLSRDSRGYITVQYRLASRRATAAMEGDVIVEGEFAGDFCRQLRLLLTSQS